MSDRTDWIRMWLTVIGCIAVIGGCALLVAPARAAEPKDAKEGASATLPLNQILELYRERDESERKVVSVPPVPASLQRLELKGRVLEDGIDFDARFEVVVLDDDDWVSVPLIAYDDVSHVSSLPKVPNGAFAIEDGELVFLTKKSGSYAFEVAFYHAAEKEDRARHLSLPHGGAALATCRLEIDGGLFRLTTDQAVDARDGVLVFPRGDRFEIDWEVRAEAEPEAAEPEMAPDIESVVPRVHASTVSTLEGRRINRVLYELRFAGRKPIEIDLTGGHTLQRAFLNGVAVPLESHDGKVVLEVAPARAGEEGGTLELVLAHPGSAFHLAGALHFDLPALSWPTHELFYTLHLPPVFDYEWAGGSLEPRSTAPAARYSYGVPLPGTALHFHQVLIETSPPDLDLDYEVNLDGHYFQETRVAAPVAACLEGAC